MQSYVVLKPSTPKGVWVEVAWLDAASATHAVEQAATQGDGAGVYLAVLASRFEPMEVEPVEAFKVKRAKSEE